MDDLDAFETEFFQRETTEAEQKNEQVEEKSDENEDDPLAAEEDKDAPEEGDEAEEAEGDDDEEESEPEPKPKPKSKAQQRIEKLLERERLATERANALEARLAALEAQKPKEEKREEAAPEKLSADQLPEGAPNPEDYGLGEFDPKFIRDLSAFSARIEIEAQLKAKQEEEQRAAYERQVNEQRAEIQKNWNSKLEETEEEIPDIRENISDLVDTFQTLEPHYGEYLASVIMASEQGPRIMHYLSQNIGEAQKIVASGPAAATLALGRLEARLTPVAKEEKRNTKRVSDAPKPPEARSRGAGGRYSVPDDTDDLDAFEREFFKRK
jgi:hypothetical protein